MKLAYVHGYLTQGYLTDLYLAQQAIDDLKFTVATDAAGKSALSYMANAKFLCRLFGQDRDPGARIKNKTQRCVPAVDMHFDNWPIANQFEGNRRFGLTRRHVKLSGLAEKPQECDQPLDPCTSVHIGAARNGQEILVCIGRLGVSLSPRGNLCEGKKVIRLVWFVVNGLLQILKTVADPVLVKIKHAVSGPRKIFLSVEFECSKE